MAESEPFDGSLRSTVDRHLSDASESNPTIFYTNSKFLLSRELFDFILTQAGLPN